MPDWLIAVLIIVIPFVALVAFKFFDDWHDRKAWRDADRSARDYLDRKRYVPDEQSDGTDREPL